MAFSYENALTGEQMRFLTLEPGPSEDEIVANLSTAKLSDDTISYDALSYCWEDQEPSQVIQCDGSDLIVTQNVKEALVALRSPLQPVNLWVDQICINQADIEERNQQVTIMADIYKRAKKVVIWLGQEATGTRRAFQVLDTFGRIGEHDLSPSQVFSVVERQQRAPSAPTLDTQTGVHATTLDGDLASLPTTQSAEWKHLLSVLSRPWFGRMWTFQEAVLGSQSTEFRCGQCIIGASAMGLATKALRDCGYAMHALFDHSAAKAIRLLEEIRAHRLDVDHNRGRPSLDSVLSSTKQLRCKDPHDKVYATLGICKTSCLEYLKVDYGQSTIQLYGSVVKASISAERDLGIMTHMRGWECEKADKPSWIPDLDDVRSAYGFLLGLRARPFKRCYTACRNLTPVLPLLTSPLYLNLRGARFQMITQRVPGYLNPSKDRDGRRSERLALLQTVQDLRIPWRSQSGEAEAPVLTDDYLTYSDGRSSCIATNETRIAAKLRRVLTADVYPRPGAKRLTDRDEMMTFPMFCAWRDRGFKGEAPSEVLEEHARFELKVMRSRALYVVGQEPHDVRLCVAPIHAQVGDWICVLFGGDAPFVLRDKKVGSQGRMDGGGSRWEFIGECYVDGIMDGEALEGKTEDDFETFVLA